MNPLLDKKAAEHYNFTIFGTSKGDNYYVMKVQPVDEVKGLLDSYEILYDNKKDLIIEVSSSLSPERIANQPDNSKIGSHNIRSSYFKTIYRIDGDNYYLISSREEIGFDKVGKKESVFIEIKNNFVVTNYSNHFFTHEDKEVFKEKTLFNKKNVILTDFWNISGLVPTEEERIIIEQFVP